MRNAVSMSLVPWQAACVRTYAACASAWRQGDHVKCDATDEWTKNMTAKSGSTLED